MEKKPYESYGFKLKDKVEIRIDKVNCKGKVFFEPKHPRYSIGSTIQAKFIEHSTEKDKFEEERHILIVEDPDGNRSTIRTTNDDQRDINYKPDYINCVVDGISKGCLILRSIGD